MVRVIEAAIDAIRPAADAKGVRVQPVLDSHATIVGDGDRLQQIAWNLLTNAIKFTPRGGRVQVRLHREDSYVELAVADDGQGIDKEFLPHVFERFRQADPSSTRKTGGLGLGLAIVRSLVELHGGTVTARSEGAGRGSTFIVRLPTAPLRADRAQARATAPTAPKAATFEAPPELRGLSVLVVDDEPDTRALLEYVLTQCEAQVTQAGSAREAVAALEQGSFDLLVSDVGMPEEDGHSLIRKVRDLPPAKGGRIPALALTAYARSEDRAAAFKAGFDMHLAKPISPAELLVVVARLVSSHGRRTPDPAARSGT
jgi:CheY-like chemotaxis protein/anti-sigma regulatory factor (Ser/Thr protein kinase)